MCKQKVEVADIINSLWHGIDNLNFNTHQIRNLDAIRRCRTAELGYHKDKCSECGTIRISYNSCRNRHCPKCQGDKREKWIQKRLSELIPVPYFHVVFTLPEQLNKFCLYKPAEIYNFLFKSAWQTIDCFAQNKGVKTGMIAVLHTWGQTLQLHPHLHCIVPAGGLTKDKSWRNISSDGKYLFPANALKKVFRAKFVALLKKYKIADNKDINALFLHSWCVFAKRPFISPAQIIEYLGRYTHRIAISNNRIISYQNNNVTFSYKDYKHGGVKKEMKLTDTEFIRRFTMHILPDAFMKIRHFGFLASSAKKLTIPLIRQQLNFVETDTPEPRKLNNFNPLICPCCGKPAMVCIEIVYPRGPPNIVKSLSNNKLSLLEAAIP